MPADTNVLGFANCWYPQVIETAQQLVLPSGATINLVSAPVFLATKFEAFADRGRGDLLGSHDLEDIVNVLDGRPEIIGEIALSQIELQHYLADRCSALLAMPNFMDALQGMIFPDESLAERVQMLGEKFKLIARGV
jgi:predicted nucleotidyltransferase